MKTIARTRPNRSATVTTPLHRAILLALSLSASIEFACAQGTTFTFRGRLEDGGAAATGGYDLRFGVFDAEAGGAQQGDPVSRDAVDVANGQFRVTLDFGAGVFAGAPRWLAIEARKVGAADYTPLEPRQPLLPTPYAIHAASAGGVSAATLTGTMIADGQVVRSLNGLKDDVSLTAGANITLTPNGQNLEIAAAGGGGGGDSVFSLNGTSAYYNAGNVGVGTSTPSARLQLHSDGPTTPMVLSTAGGPDGAGAFRIQADSGLGAGRPALSIYDETFSKYLMVLNGWSALGLGTTIPRGNLHIHNPGTTATFVVSTGSGIDGPGSFRLQADSGLGAGRPALVVYDETFSKYLMVLNGWSGLGLGTALPRGNLHVHSPGTTATFVVSTGSGSEGPAQYRVQADSGLGGQGPSLVVYDDIASQYRMALNGSGNLGIGTPAPQEKLHVAGGYIRVDGVGNEQVYIGGDGIGNDAQLGSANPAVTSVVLWNKATQRRMNLVVSALEITGGADLAEPFKTSEPSIPAGTVVVIDEDHPGQLKTSTEAYDRRVAGIISGANGIRPGLTLHQEGRVDGNQNVALTGRVYVKADAASGPIRPGDLLTTSDTPGHAMKVADQARAQGAILGKAMTALPSGQGEVLVLVTLQ